MEQDKYLIVNADDFGQSEAISRGIVRACEAGIVTSTSLMPCCPASAAAADYARRHPQLGLGLHVDLGEWACRDWIWYPVYEVADLDDPREVRAAVYAQLDAFRALMGCDPDHLDSHQHVHRGGAAGEIMRELAAKLGVPLRQCGKIRYCGDFYGQTTEGAPYHEALTVENLVRIIASLRPGVTELACHPGVGVPIQSTAYAIEREMELESLCHTHTREALATHQVRLCTFAQLQTGLP